mgnify:FL=1
MTDIKTECGTTVSKRIRNENDFNRINKEGQLSFSEMIANWVEKLNGKIITDGEHWKNINNRPHKNTSTQSVFNVINIYDWHD